ncbi:hypothetical protein ACFOQM_15985 [Paenibacillus sp. GCM10012307]|uniref:Uncharacterized protein n=1 Tax=Paenibacillus roseus TaxID=2798579 RepID=A0A934J4K2_9BACL|nr:hypothetical protein [Paenibacillus roseus]MBJ6362745.1 hypothetical protein [Paenibacillus roseus]
MKRYLKLVHMEVHRFRYLMLFLMGVILIFQVGAIISVLSRELSQRWDDPTYNGVRSPFVPEGMLSFTWVISNTNFWFAVPMLISVAVIGLYVFFVWYREWLGRSTFIYRLLMLPGARCQIYLAKLTAILIFVFSLVSYQLLLLPLQKLLFQMMVPAEWRVDSYWPEVIHANRALDLLIPRNIEQFLSIYGLGIMAVLIIFTGILLERSYRRIGILYGLLYVVGNAIVALYLPDLLGLGLPGTYLYPDEIVGLVVGVCLLLLVLSVVFGFRLLANKITV